MEGRWVVGTAGHIDHGKSALVCALTGVHPDRLAEEKRRGITIELGFVPFEIGGMEIGIVDVPGHERFIKTMVAGAIGMDIVLLVIAADEGIMPQTREHLEICHLLGVRRGIVVLSRVDRVEADWLALVHSDITAALQGTFLQDAPRCEVSSLTGQGIDTLKTTLQEILRTLPPKSSLGVPRLPLDRVFEEKGFGPVVTGTLLSGEISEGALIRIFPGGHEARIRGLQVHKKPVAKAFAGQRTAVNLQGIEIAALHRGQVLLSSHPWETSPAVDVWLRVLPHAPRPLKHRTPLLFHAGTEQIACTLWLPKATTLPPGSSGFARLLLERQAVFFGGDPFLLRGTERLPGHGTTLGGGLILDPLPPPRLREDPSLWERLSVLHQAQPLECLSLLAHDAGIQGVSPLELQQRLPFPSKIRDTSLAKLLSQGRLLLTERDPPRYVSLATLESHATRLLHTLKDFHLHQPALPGISRELLRSLLALPLGRFWSLLLERLSSKGLIVLQDDLLHLPDHHAASADILAFESRLLSLLQSQALHALRPSEIAERLSCSETDLRPHLQRLLKQKTLLRLADDLFFLSSSVQLLRSSLESFLLRQGSISPQEFKSLVGTSRKFSIPLAEYFDSIGLTTRSGDLRKLR